MSEPIKCEFLVFRGTYLDPPEYCPNDAEPGYEYCLDHMPYEPDPDEERDKLRDYEWESDFE